MLYNLWLAIESNQNEINIYFTTYLQSIQLKGKERKGYLVSGEQTSENLKAYTVILRDPLVDTNVTNNL